MVRRYHPNPSGTKNVFSDICVLTIHIYALSLSCLAMGINFVQDKGPVTRVSYILYIINDTISIKRHSLDAQENCKYLST